MSDLTSSLAALSASLAKPKGIRSDNKSATPISLIAYIFFHATSECYKDYTKGAELLVKWLTLGQAGIDYELDKYPKQLDTSFKIPMLISNYTMQALARAILKSDIDYSVQRNSEAYWANVSRIEKALYLVTLDIIKESHD